MLLCYVANVVWSGLYPLLLRMSKPGFATSKHTNESQVRNIFFIIATRLIVFSASGVVLQTCSLPTMRSASDNPTLPTPTTSQQRANSQHGAPIIWNIRIAADTYTAKKPHAQTDIYTYIV